MADDFQRGVESWVLECLGRDELYNKSERAFRFLEEALELAQATNVTKEDTLKLVDYVFSRPTGERYQEVGGVMTTLAALCVAYDMNMNKCGAYELERNWGRIEQIRQKHFNKPRNSPLPGSVEVSKE